MTLNGVVPKPITTMQHLLNNFLIITTVHLQATQNNKPKTELQTINIHKCQMRNRRPPDWLVIQRRN